MSRHVLLDLFCGAGGASRGYVEAGFEVVGVDHVAQPHYPYEFHQADALTFPIDGFDAIHASPPCQDHSPLLSLHDAHGTAWMLQATIDRLRPLGVPWVVENVVGAPLHNSETLFGQYGAELCGTMFGLRVLRHRLFEASFPIPIPTHGSHEGNFYTVAGHGDPNWSHRAGSAEFSGHGYAKRCADAMGIDWMNRDELAQAIPPAYTRWIGEQLMAYLGEAAA